MALHMLIAEDAPDVAEAVAFGMRMSLPQCAVSIASTGQEALDQFAQRHVDLMVLDLMLPPPDGFEVCRRVREVSAVPILVLTVRDAVLDKVRALELGADDYLTKPFDHVELLARLRALLRRASCTNGSMTMSSAHERVVVGDFELDATIREVRLRGKSIALTATEYRLLEELALNAGQTLPHRLLLERVWGTEYLGETHYLKVFIRRLRNKLGDAPDHPCFIHTERGLGYRFAAVAH